MTPQDRENLVQVFGGWVTKAEAEAREAKFKDWVGGILTSTGPPPAPTLLSLVRRRVGAGGDPAQPRAAPGGLVHPARR